MQQGKNAWPTARLAFNHKSSPILYDGRFSPIEEWRNQIRNYDGAFREKKKKEKEKERRQMTTRSQSNSPSDTGNSFQF